MGTVRHDLAQSPTLGVQVGPKRWSAVLVIRLRRIGPADSLALRV